MSSKVEAQHGAVLTIPMAENVEQAKLGLENILCDPTSSHVLYIVVVPKENPHTDASSKVLAIPSSSSLSPRVQLKERARRRSMGERFNSCNTDVLSKKSLPDQSTVEEAGFIKSPFSQ